MNSKQNQFKTKPNRKPIGNNPFERRSGYAKIVGKFKWTNANEL